jgi:hypothetical protein
MPIRPSDQHIVKDGAAFDLFHMALLHKALLMPVIKSAQRQLFAAPPPAVDRKRANFAKR